MPHQLLRCHAHVSPFKYHEISTRAREDPPVHTSVQDSILPLVMLVLDRVGVQVFYDFMKFV